MPEYRSPQPHPIETILFDCDGVLVDSTEANVATYQNLFREAGQIIPSAKAIRACAHLDFRGIINQLSGREVEAAQIDKLRAILSVEGVRTPGLLKFPPGLFATLLSLSAQYKLGIATSRSRLGMQDVFGAAPGLEDHFEAVVTADDYSRPKPDGEPLLVAANALGTTPQATLYVGDNVTDMLAAREAAMRSICVSNVKLPLAQAWVRNIIQLPAVLNSQFATPTD